jgi:putative addiction module component (TIGR02574 family)
MQTKLQQLTVDERIKLVEDLWDSKRLTKAHFRLPLIREPNSTAA